MMERDWHEATDPTKMVQWLGRSQRASERKLRLALLLTVLVFAEPRAATASGDHGREEAEARLLIQKLASANYQEREAAMRGLAALGEKALASLRAAKDSHDPEVRHRASGLLRPLEAKVRRREIDQIKKSKLKPAEKGRMLKPFLTKGLSFKEVERILGKGVGRRELLASPPIHVRRLPFNPPWAGVCTSTGARPGPGP